MAKTSKTYPYAAIEHRVIDSDAYADLTFSAKALLTLFARQLSKDNNGHLQASFAYVRRHGFGSQRTLVRATQELIAHGMVYRTRSGGYQQGAAKFAVTWLPISKIREGLFLTGFRPFAWRDWTPEKNKTPPAKMHSDKCSFGTWTGLPSAESALSRGAKNAHIELMPCIGDFSPLPDPAETPDRHAMAESC